MKISNKFPPIFKRLESFSENEFFEKDSFSFQESRGW